MKIGEIAAKTGLSAHTLRFYEKLGFVKAAKADNGHRQYDQQDLELLNWVACLKHSGMSLSRIKHYVSASQQGDKQAMAEVLTEHLALLQRQQQDIIHYLDVTSQKLQRLKNKP